VAITGCLEKICNFKYWKSKEGEKKNYWQNGKLTANVISVNHRNAYVCGSLAGQPVQYLFFVACCNNKFCLPLQVLFVFAAMHLAK
jgi:hypothetical protein